MVNCTAAHSKPRRI
nr:unnamed protein product [Callosobruchus chinensis]